METQDQLENPVIKDDAGAKFLEAARLHDRGEDIPSDLIPQVDEPAETPIEAETAEVELEENVPTAEELADPANKDRARDPATGKFIKKSEVASTEVQTVDAKPVSEFEQKKLDKAAKEKERQDRSWESLNRQKEELEARRRELEQREQQAQQPRRQKPEPRKFHSQQFIDAHADFVTRERQERIEARKALEIGDYDSFGRHNDEADQQAILAIQAQESAKQFYAVEQQEALELQKEQYAGVWRGHLNEAFKAEPELSNAASPLSKEVQGLLEAHGQQFWLLPDGFKHLVRIAKLQLDAKDAPTLREQLAKERAENARLNGKLQPTAAGVTGPARQQSFDDNKPDEQFASIMRAARSIDSGE
jgi:hypothetical protein